MDIYFVFSIYCIIFAGRNQIIEVMTAVQMQLNAELFGALQTISGDEGLMKKAVRSLKRIASQKQAKDENMMSMAELEETVRQGEEDIAKGNFQTIAIDDLWK